MIQNKGYGGIILIMIIGYARVSTQEQSLDRQIDVLKNYGAEQIFEEKITGTIKNRPELDKMKAMLRENDVVVIESLSRLGRSSKDLLALIEEFRDRKVTLVSLRENIDISTPTGQLMFTVLAALCQFERDLTVQRTKDGLMAARARGRKGGRRATDPKKIEKALKLYESQTHSIKEIIAITGVSHGVLYKAINAAKAQIMKNNAKNNL
jgi:DNA invertase Pin-like site-specific DNA recombinase